MNQEEKIDDYLNKPYWVIDLLPEQVPANSRGQYFKIEQYFLQASQMGILCRKFAHILMKLNCYDDMEVVLPTEETTLNPSPEKIMEWFVESSHKKQFLYFLFVEWQAMITFSGDDLYLTVYNPSPKMLELLYALSASEGLFLWQPPQEKI